MRKQMSASIKGEMRPAIYRFRLGSFEVASMLDSKIIREGLTPSHGGELLAAEVRALAIANRIDPLRYEHSFIPCLVNTAGSSAIAGFIFAKLSSSRIQASVRRGRRGVILMIAEEPSDMILRDAR